jgi:hypothetical protein
MTMEVEKAIRQLSDIHDVLSRTRYYRGYRAIPVFISGGFALMAAFFQPAFIGQEPGYDYARYWAACGLVAFLVAVTGPVVHFRKANSFYRSQTLRAFGQFFPALLAGAGITAAGWKAGTFPVEYLPGLWSICFALGIFASSHFLPRAILAAAAFYFAAGIFLLLLGESGRSLDPWGMGITFGGGQFLCAAILYWNLERKSHD